MAAGNTKEIAVSSFSTELNSDVLIVNGFNYSGFQSPQGQVPQGEILWSTDGVANDLGWKLCLVDPFWTVVSGTCATDGRCIQSPLYPSPYPNSQGCEIDVRDGNTEAFTVTFFETEDGWDHLMVNSVLYSGSTGPDGQVPQGRVSWAPDSSLSKGGWQLCLQATTTTTTAVSELCQHDGLERILISSDRGIRQMVVSQNKGTLV